MATKRRKVKAGKPAAAGRMMRETAGCPVCGYPTYRNQQCPVCRENGEMVRAGRLPGPRKK